VISLICPKNSTRLRYVVDYLAKRWGVSINIEAQQDLSVSADNIVLNYTNQANSDHFSIYNEGLLLEDHLRTKDQFPEVRIENKITQLFPSDYDRYSINFDILSSIFFCLSRHEEYLPFSPDKHGRFRAQNSHAFEHKYLRLPVVDIWISFLLEQLNDRFQLDLKLLDSFYIQPTIDVDSAWAYQHRSVAHKIGSSIKHLFAANTQALRSQWTSTQSKDPYDSFEYLIESLKDLDPIFFFLMNFKRPYDTAHYIDLPAFASLVKRISVDCEIGIHPSYTSFQNSNAVKIEKDKLEDITQRKIEKSRQHFLRLSLPETYELLISQDIKEDFSLGYADQIGFRAGTSLPFLFYNLKDESQTELLLRPFSIMDVTLKQYHQYSIDEAIEELRKMKSLIRQTNGCLHFIWHNSSFAEFEG